MAGELDAEVVSNVRKIGQAMRGAEQAAKGLQQSGAAAANTLNRGAEKVAKNTKLAAKNMRQIGAAAAMVSPQLAALTTGAGAFAAGLVGASRVLSTINRQLDRSSRRTKELVGSLQSLRGTGVQDPERVEAAIAKTLTTEATALKLSDIAGIGEAVNIGKVGGRALSDEEFIQIGRQASRFSVQTGREGAINFARLSAQFRSEGTEATEADRLALAASLETRGAAAVSGLKGRIARGEFAGITSVAQFMQEATTEMVNRLSQENVPTIQALIRSTRSGMTTDEMMSGVTFVERRAADVQMVRNQNVQQDRGEQALSVEAGEQAVLGFVGRAGAIGTPEDSLEAAFTPVGFGGLILEALLEIAGNTQRTADTGGTQE